MTSQHAGNGGVEYASASGNSVSAEYRYTDARFPRRSCSTARRSIRLRREHRTRHGQVRPHRRDPVPGRAPATCGAAIRTRRSPRSPAASATHRSQWQPTEALQVVLMGRHEFKAYVDSESDYFVSNGGTLEPGWKPTPALLLRSTLSYEHHDYLGVEPERAHLRLTARYRHTQQARSDLQPGALSSPRRSPINTPAATPTAPCSRSTTTSRPPTSPSSASCENSSHRGRARQFRRRVEPLAVAALVLPGMWDEDGDVLFVGIGTILDKNLPPARTAIVFGTGAGYTAPPPDIASSSDRWRLYGVRGPLTARSARARSARWP